MHLFTIPHGGVRRSLPLDLGGIGYNDRWFYWGNNYSWDAVTDEYAALVHWHDSGMPLPEPGFAAIDIMAWHRANSADDEPKAEPPCSWRDRLDFDHNVSESSPVVKGTWVTVAHVVTLIVDGWSWSDILRSHPELVEDDIRACLAFEVEGSRDGN